MPVVSIARKDKLVKSASDATKKIDSCIKIRLHMPNIDELLNQISRKNTGVRKEPLSTLKTDLEYAYGQLIVPEETSKQCNFAITAGNMNR